jgi:uncharacterized protein YggE
MRFALIVWIALACAAAAQEPAQPQNNVVVTIGDATVRRAPDRAFVTVSVETRAKSPRDAQRLNAEAMTAVQQRLTQARLAPDAVRTTGYDLQQEFDFVQGKRVPREFVARNGVEVRLDDIARTGEILDSVVQSGATSVSGIRFDLKDRDAAEREALRLAVADARARADAAASGAGRAIDRVLRIEDSREMTINPPRPVMRMMAGTTEGATQTPIEPGTIEIRARVTLTASLVR